MNATDPKTGHLIPPSKCLPGRCDWLLKDGHRCSENATWCSPTIDENWQFKWGRICETHKPIADALLDRHGIEASWQRI